MNYAVLLSAIALSSALLVLQSRAAQSQAAPASQAPATPSPALQNSDQAPPAAALAPEQVQIYRAFLSSYNGSSKQPLHLANATAPFESTEDDLTGCLKDFPAHPEATGTHSLAALDSDANIQLVDADQFQIATPGSHDELAVAADKALSNGLLTLSEIVFTADHQFAAMSYNLACGGFCRRGGTAVFEHSPNGWMRVNRFCSSWHS